MKIIQIIQAVDRVTGLDDDGNVYILEHIGEKHFWVPIVIEVLPPGSKVAVPTGPGRTDAGN